MKNRVPVDYLGICECCGLILTSQDLPATSIDSNRRCPRCKVLITRESFGYEFIREWEKVKWVNEKGEWQSTRPTEDFRLGGFLAEIQIPHADPA